MVVVVVVVLLLLYLWVEIVRLGSLLVDVRWFGGFRNLRTADERCRRGQGQGLGQGASS
jgi:hypothetical protein